MTAEEQQIEQRFVDRAYENLDMLRDRYRRTQRKAEASGAWGTPQARTERDVTAAHYGDRAARLERVEDRLVFGRLDRTDDSTMYIGRVGLKNEDDSRLLTDWRAPAAMPFYRATAGDPLGVVRRRHISTRLREVQSLEDELLDTSSSTEGLHFQGEGALMASLGAARDGYMSDIVATIQAEQDAVVRAPARGILVVQGGPGTGKTAVALHRAAYLLYAERDRLERSGALIIGPGREFLRYIEQVLPSLGETGVVSTTMGDLLPGFSTETADEPAVARAKGSLAWIPTLKAAVRSLQRIPSEPIELRIGTRKCSLRPDDVRAARTRARRSGKPHNEARDGFALEMIEVLAAELAGDDADPDTIAWWRERVRESVDARREINLCWMPSTPTRLLARLYANPQFLENVQVGLSQEDRRLVRRENGAWTVADVPLLDELEELLGFSPLFGQKKTRGNGPTAEEVERAQVAIASQGLGGGLVTAEMLADRAQGETEWRPLSERARDDRTWAYGHIVVDEAQDLTPMMWHSLLRRCPSRSFTVVGDLDQARGQERPSSWFEALGPAGGGLSDEAVLSVSYRTPRTITDLAARVQAACGSPVKYPVVAARDLPDALQVSHATAEGLAAAVTAAVDIETAILSDEVGPEAGRVAVITAPQYLERLPEFTDNRVSVFTPTSTKGLEFDSTVLVEPAAILRDGPGDLFVAMTRSTKRLHTVHSEPLPAGWAPQSADS